MIRPLMLAGIVTTLVTCWPHAATAAAPSSQPAPGTLRVMSFNIRYGTARDGEDAWEKRKAFLLDTIKAFNPDLLGMQEVLHGQTLFLKESLPDYGFLGTGRDDGKEKGEYSPIMYRKARFDVEDSGQFWLSETPERIASKAWDAALPRIVTWAKLKDKATGRSLLYHNTHWDHVGKVARLESAKLMRQRIAKDRGDLPVIVTGDFNTTEELDPYAELVKKEADGLKLLDAYRQAHPQQKEDEASFHGFKGGVKGARIDWVLHTPDWVTRQATIDRTSKDGRYPSDHYAVTAVLKPKP